MTDLPPSEPSNSNERLPTEREESLCPCKSRLTYAACCQTFHQGKTKPKTAEELMRSRYSAYFFRLVGYLVDTHHPDTRSPNLKKELDKSVHNLSWKFLTIVQTSKGTKDDTRGKVKFVADYYLEGEPMKIEEHSRFKKVKGMWKYLDDKG
ncbi:YchJ family metal-binding protein [Akkermansiaceae bacterium]|nr:YchJ family metal-binding protein [Akkermansiaceae bacterium]MDB4419010.1 YchJ family metal-binding protein [bacterium]MDB4508164.1 YchJ family metal-binding protein [Akkermansiaceae bacterium]MDB4541477.1 YchJ family metal-binding protein [Akkermansiaceae bacterium]